MMPTTPSSAPNIAMIPLPHQKSSAPMFVTYAATRLASTTNATAKPVIVAHA